jgi:hypothetical protein
MSLPEQKETGMLQQGPFGLLSTFLYNHDFMLKHQDFFARFIDNSRMNNLVPVQTDPISLQIRFADLAQAEITPGMEVLISLMAEHNSGALHQFIRAIFSMYKNGIRGMTPSKHLCESMALTQANYDASEFHLPYPCTVIELPIEFRSKFTLKPFLAEARQHPQILEAMESYYKTDFKALEENGLPPRYIIMMEHEHDEVGTAGIPNFAKFDGAKATRTLTTVLVSDLTFKRMLCPILKIQKPGYQQPFEFRIMNPMCLAVFQRPLYRGVSLHNILTAMTGIKNDGSPYSTDLDEQSRHSMIQMTLLCANICHALTHMGMEVKEQAGADKLRARGSNLAQRCMPTTIAPALTIITESNKTQRDDSDVPSEPTGRVISPHYRIGHFRKQHYGAGGKDIKTVWIAPTLVNKYLLQNPDACVFVKTQKDFDKPVDS